MATPAVLIALTPHERKLFFEGPKGSCSRLADLFPDARYFSLGRADSTFAAVVADLRPQIIISAWSTPTIPADARGLEYICHVGGSVKRHVPRPLIERGVLVTNWDGSIAETVAEAALLLILSALRRSHYFAHLMHVDKGWEWPPSGTQSLFDRRIGLHGFGAIARRLVPMLELFRPQLSAYTPGLPSEAFSALGVRPASSLEDLFANADVLVELEALTPASLGIVSERVLNLLPEGATFVNIGRGGVVDEAALAKLAAEKRLRVALDVYQTEPLAADSVLRALPEVVLFPHQGGPTSDRAYLCGELALANLRRFLAGEAVEGQVSLEIFDRST